MIRGKPVSAQTNNRGSLLSWKRLVRSEAERAWADRGMIGSGDVRLTLVYLCQRNPVDVDNIIKPIQDALEGLVFADDIDVTDVESHRRLLSARLKVDLLPPLLAAAVMTAVECVYVRVSNALRLEDAL